MVHESSQEAQLQHPSGGKKCAFGLDGRGDGLGITEGEEVSLYTASTPLNELREFI